MNESDIIHECGVYWVLKERDRYTVFKAGLTHSVSDSSYPGDADGLSLAIARCNYKGNQTAEKGKS